MTVELQIAANLIVADHVWNVATIGIIFVLLGLV
jgi:hypothetical protein